MNGFFDFGQPSKKQLRAMAGGFETQRENGLGRETVMPIMEAFRAFLQETLTAVQARAKKIGEPSPVLQLKQGYDPKAHPDRFIKEVWGAWADFWPLIETVPTYQLTMLTILEKFRIPESGTLRLVSSGSGPGIYETFLARLLQSSGIGGKITCVDLAPEMAAMQSFIANLNPPALRNLEAITADMASVPLPDGCADAVLCNNSLQWSREWRTAIGEMARLLGRKSGDLYLFVHMHKQQMHMRTSTGEKILDMEPVLVDDIMDEIEKNSFTVTNTRQINGGDGMGQLGGRLDRVFIKARLTPGGTKSPWRKAKISVTGTSAFKVG